MPRRQSAHVPSLPCPNRSSGDEEVEAPSTESTDVACSMLESSARMSGGSVALAAATKIRTETKR